MGVGFGIRNGLGLWVTGDGLEKACVSCPDQLLYRIEAIGELTPVCCKQSIFTTNISLSQLTKPGW